MKHFMPLKKLFSEQFLTVLPKKCEDKALLSMMFLSRATPTEPLIFRLKIIEFGSFLK